MLDSLGGLSRVLYLGFRPSTSSVLYFSSIRKLAHRAFANQPIGATFSIFESHVKFRQFSFAPRGQVPGCAIINHVFP